MRLTRKRATGDPEAERLEWQGRGLAFAESWPEPADAAAPAAAADNPLRAFFDARREGRGIWKWEHYFDAYHRHLERFRGRDVHVLEIGIYSGGSLELWREYLGARVHLYGVDIEEACRRYEDGATRIFIGDQADRDFWRRFRAEVPDLDVVIDDGGHMPLQQSVTLEELLPHLRPGGVYLCEDHHGSHNRFVAYVSGLSQALHAQRPVESADPERRSVSRNSGFQSLVDSIHSYPFLTVIERRGAPLLELVAPKHGTEWEPFLR
jgi:SAM-dependent methyltransferase